MMHRILVRYIPKVLAMGLCLNWLCLWAGWSILFRQFSREIVLAQANAVEKQGEDSEKAEEKKGNGRDR